MDQDIEIISYEEEIVWTEDVSKFDYVRVHLDRFAGTRRQPVRWSGPGRRVGYSVLRGDAPVGEPPMRFARRVFWVKDYDRSEKPNGVYTDGAPAEAIDPRTIAPGIWGDLTPRASRAEGAYPGESSEGRHTEDPGRPKKSSAPSAADVEIRVGQSSLAGGSAMVGITPVSQGRVEIFIDCASGTTLGDGTHVISEVLPKSEAHALLVGIVKTTPWLQEALALFLVDRWISAGTAAFGARRGEP